MNILDLVMTLLIPVLLVAVLMLATLAAVLQALERKKRLKETLILNGRYDNLHVQAAEVKVAKFLTIVSLTLLVLHSPSHVIRLKMLIASYVCTDEPSNLDYSLQRVFEVMFYLNFSANLIIYISAGDNFRSILLQKLVFKVCRDTIPSKPEEQKPITNELKEAMELTAVNHAFDNISVNDEEHQCGS